MKLPSITDGQAQILIGVTGLAIGLYAIYQTKDTIAKAATATKDALDITSDKNLASKAARATLGEDFVIDKIGGGVASIVDWFTSQPENAPTPTNLKTETKKIIQTPEAEKLFPFVKQLPVVKTTNGVLHG